MIHHDHVTRRTVLRGLGATVALPTLEVFAGGRKPQEVQPKLVFLGFPYGIRPDHFYLKTDKRKEFELTEPLSVLKAHQNDFTIFRNLNNVHKHNSHDSCSTLLTDADVFNSKSGKPYQNAISCDQVAAKHLGKDVRYSNLVLSSPAAAGPANGGWGNGLSLSWNEVGSPIPAITRPVDLHHAIFGGGESKVELLYRLNQKRSLLDAYVGDFKRLQGKVTREDRDKLEEYANSIRMIELRLAREREWSDIPFPKATMNKPGPEIPSGSTAEHRLYFDLIAVALHTGQTNVISWRMSLDGVIREVGYKSDGHGLNHSHGDPDKKFGVAKDVKLLANYAYFPDKLKTLKEADGTSVFDNAAVSIGSNVKVNHDTRDLPLIVAGRLQGKLKQGQQIRFTNGPGRMSDVWLTLLQSAGCPVETFSTSRGAVSEMI